MTQDLRDRMVERVGSALRAECLKIYGTNWSNDVAWQLARAAIEEMRKPTSDMEVAGGDHQDGLAINVWQAMITAALAETNR